MKFKFYNRDQELNILKKSFLNLTVKKKLNQAFIIQGRKGVGKTRLVLEFINNIETDKQIHYRIPKFRKSRNVFMYNCTRNSNEPYQAFIELTKGLEKQKKKFRILQRVLMLFVSFFQIYDLLDAFEKLSDEIRTGESEEEIQVKETKLFKKYISLLNKKSSKAPIVLYIQNVQWIDDHSLKLLQTLIDDQESIWGMIILEEEDAGSSNINIQSIFKDLIEENKVKRLALKPFHKGFESYLLEAEFGVGFFTTKEYEYIYTNSEGCPGRLENLLNSWINVGWIYQEGTQWKKIEGFEEKIKPPYQRLFDLIITFLQDGIISKREEKLLQSHATEWNISQDVVTSMIGIIRNAKKLGFEIDERLQTGSIGSHAFLAHDKNRNRYVIEYVPNLELGGNELVPKEIKHKHILPAKMIIPIDNSIFIVYEFYDGKNLKEINEEAHEIRIKDNLDIALQIAEGLEELHKNGNVHGYLRPESIIKKENGEIKITAIDASQIHIKEPETDEEYIAFASYFSPEQIEGKELTKASDIFSFGVLFYELLTGELPFTGKTKAELNHSIRFDPFIPFEFSRLPNIDDIQKILQKCLNKNPKDRYQNASELIEDLRKLTPFTSPVSPASQPGPSKLPKKKPVKPIIGFVGGIVVLVIIGLLLFKSHSPTKHYQNGIVVLSKIDMQNRSSENFPFQPEILNYLIKDDILQSSSLNVMDLNSLHSLYGRDVEPEVFVKNKIINQPIGFTINTEIISAKKGIIKKKLKVIQPSELLTGKISKITKAILDAMNVHEVKKSKFTRDWDAFVNFYKGEQAWEKLEITRAKRYFKAALIIDPDFILAKLREASVLSFQGDNSKALNIIKLIKPELRYLSESDSLKAEALLARLNGNLRKEILILKQIYSKVPSRKEAPFDVAEAYYQICDIQNAIDYYKKTLYLDKNFAKAYNHLAYCYTHLGAHEEAIKNFHRYNELDSTANSFDSMGDGYFAAGLLDSAIWAKKQGIKIDPKLNYLYQGLFYINLFKGDMPQARRNISLYENTTYGTFGQARTNYLLALLYFNKGDYDSTLFYCKKSLSIFDSKNPALRNHELHWLLGKVYLKLNRIKDAKKELNEMEEIIAKNNINATNYRMGIYKFMLHLKALIAAYNLDIPTIINIIEEFDGPIRDKVKDHESVFDLSYFNTSFGKIFMRQNINRLDLAENRFYKALDYNSNYAFAHYNLWKLFKRKGEEIKASKHYNQFIKNWNNKDTIFELLDLP